ncbi:MAG: dihydrolipoyl dehydrogenase [Candidatus Hydrogenedentota bacterium]
MTKETTNVAVLGGGPAGYAAAFMAADLGLEVTLIELDTNPGGTCLYRGCIPSKALLHVAKVIHEAEEASHFGLNFGKPKIDIDRVREATREIVKKMTGGLGQLCKARKVRYIQGRGSFMDSHTLHISLAEGGEMTLGFENAIIATGSRPATLPHLALESDRMMNSTDALELESIPKTLLVIGGGYIGLELTTVYAALGSKVTVVDIAPTLLAGADADLVKPLAVRMKELCEAIHLETTINKLEETKTGIKVSLTFPDGKTKSHTFEKVLMSVGRKPNSSGIGLENTDVVETEQGFVEVDEQMRTAESHIFAIGDLVGQPMLAHKGNAEGRVAAEVIAGKKSAFDVRCIPAVVFTDPEVAWVGITEAEAKAADRAVNVGKFPWAASGRATTVGRNDGLTKLICDAETDEVLGMGLVGVGAGELIAEGALAIEMGANATDLALTIHPHPTLNETIMESAELVHGSSTHIYRPPRKKKKA